MRYILHNAKWLLVAEVVISAVLLVGLLVPLPGKIELKIVQSGSMEPRLPVGSVVVVMPEVDYKVGDIITFGKDTKKRIPTTHRIVKIERENGSVRYVTKGDANEEADSGKTQYPAVIGKVVGTIPRLGYVLDFARSRRGFTFMVVIPALFVMLDELITIFNTAKDIKKKEKVTVKKRRVRSNKKYNTYNVNVGNSRRIVSDIRAGIDGCRVIPTNM